MKESAKGRFFEEEKNLVYMRPIGKKHLNILNCISFFRGLGPGGFCSGSGRPDVLQFSAGQQEHQLANFCMRQNSPFNRVSESRGPGNLVSIIGLEYVAFTSLKQF